MLGAAVVGGLILALIEGISLGLNRMTGSAALQEQLSKYLKLNFKISYTLIFNK